MRNDYDELETYNHNNDDYNEYGGHREMTMTYDDLDRLVSSKVRGSMLWMVLGLLLTGGAGFLVYSGLESGSPIAYGILNMYWVFAILEVVMVFGFTALLYRANSGTLRMMFVAYSILNGLTLSVIGLIYAPEIIFSAFLGTLTLFVVLAVYGYFTKENLTKFTPILIAGLITLILVSIINIFLQSSGVDLFISVIGVIIFTIFIAVDVNRIRNNIITYAVQEDSEILNKIEIVGALNLYLDFINLFLYILRILGRKR
jgi:putative membrane protein